ncbi:MAG: dihydroneopterin aldolase [Sulfurovum sp.]|nr:dihydroneopterin aldolase [Sulfurovum sp.]
MRIHIENLKINCIIGLLDFEREIEQRVILDIKIDYSYMEGQFLDYSSIASNIENHLKKTKYELLESSLIGIKTLLFEKYDTIEKLAIKISKPDILDNCSVGLSDTWDINTLL